MLGIIFTGIVDMVKGWLAVRAAQQATQLQLHKQIQTQDNQQLALQSLQLLSFKTANFLRITDFFILLTPYIVCIFAPDSVKIYFAHVANSIPAWFQYITVGAFYAIWGLGKHIDYRNKT